MGNKWWFGVLVCLVQSGTVVRTTAQVLTIGRGGPVQIGRPLPRETTGLKLVGPGNRILPVQWQWIEYPPLQTSGFRWARLCFIPSRPGRYRLHYCKSQLANRKPVKGFLPPGIFMGEDFLPGCEEGNAWVGPVCTRRVLHKPVGRGGRIDWELQVQTWDGGDLRLELTVTSRHKKKLRLPAIRVSLPPGIGRLVVSKGGGQGSSNGWVAIPGGTTLMPGETCLARAFRNPQRDKYTGLHWGDIPKVAPRELCSLPLPGAPALLRPAAKGKFRRQETALDNRLRLTVEEMCNHQGRDRGDLKDRKGEWLNLEYDLPWGLILHYLRTGNPLFLGGAMVGLDHMTTTDRAGTARFDAVRGMTIVHGRTHRGGGTETGHVWVQGMVAGALLTGDRRLLLLAAESVRVLAKTVQDRGGAEQSRCLGWPGLALTTWCELTAAPVAKWAQGQLAKHCCETWDGGSGTFLLADEVVAPGVWVVPLWVQAALLPRLVIYHAPQESWADRCAGLLYRSGQVGPASLTVLAGRGVRVGRTAPLTWLGLALAGTAELGAGRTAWQRAAKTFARGMVKELSRADARGVSLIARSWPLIVSRFSG